MYVLRLVKNSVGIYTGIDCVREREGYMTNIFVVLFLISSGVLIAVWHRKQYWKEEYHACENRVTAILCDALREENNEIHKSIN